MEEITLPTALFLLFIIVQRLSELALAKRNTRRLIERGAVEVGASHYPLMVTLHTCWVLSLLFFGYANAISWAWLYVFALLQIFRLWILFSLGQRWTTRIIILDEPLVRSGPFAFLNHPNYLLVVLEIFVAPMVLGLFWVAVMFSILNAAMLTLRISVEERALSHLRRP
ncbi:MAG: isoprenylcysteine carboxylmethyltransferase family protein [Pseudomonadota bacterium]